MPVPLRSTRNPVGLLPEGRLVTTKSNVFDPGMKPVLIVNGDMALKLCALTFGTATPFSMTTAESSAATCPLSTTVAGLKPVRSNVVR